MKNNFHVQIAKSLLANLTQKSTNMLFIKYYNAFDIPVEDTRRMISNNNKIRLLYHQYDSSTMQDAYEPFLGWTKELYYEFFGKEMSIDEFLYECDVYMVQRIVFETYFKYGKCSRDEEPLANEVEFEEGRFIDSIINMLVYISKRISLIFVLDKLHLSCSSVVKLINRLIQRDDTNNIALEASFNELYHIQTYMQYEWFELMKSVQNKNLSYDVESVGDEEGQELRKNFVFDIEKMDEYIVKIVNMVYTLAFHQSLYYLNIIYDKIVFEKINVSYDDKFKIFALLSLTDINTNNPEHASFMCESINSLLKEKDNLYYEFSSNYLQVMTQVYFKQKSNAEKCVDECMRIAKMINDEKLILKTKLIYHWSLGVWCDVLFNFSHYEEPDDEFIEELMANGYINSVIYMCGLCKEQTPEDIKLIDEGKKPLVYFRKALKIANDIGNINVIAQLFNRKHVFAHSINCYNFLDEITKEKNKYVYIDDNDVSYAQSSAYMSSQREEYEESHRHNNNALNSIYNKMIKDRFEQGLTYKIKKTDVVLRASFLKKNNLQNMEDTIHNLSINCISAGDYQMACKYLMTMITIMESENRLRFTNGNIAKIYGMTALCYYYMDIYYNCYMYMEKAERHMSHLIHPLDGEEPSFAFWDDCMYFYRFVKGLLLKAEENLEEAKEEFKQAEIHMEPLYSCYFFIYPTFAIEKADLLRKLGDKEEAKRVLEVCLDYCYRENLYDKVRMLEAELDGVEYTRTNYDFNLTGVTIEQLLDATRYQSYEYQFSEHQSDTLFISSWQDILNNNSDTEMLLNNAMEVIEKIYVLDGAVFIKVQDATPKIMYNDTNVEINEQNVKRITEMFEQHQTPFITNRIDKSYNSFRTITSLFGINNVVTLIGIPVIREAHIDSIFITFSEMKENFRGHYSLMKEERLNIIQLAINQLVDAERRLVTKHKLEASLRREEKANEAKSTFLANMSHEIRTPMNTVMGMCEIVLRDELSDSVRYNVEGILSASNNLLSIINDILDFSKIESGKMSIVEADYELSELIDDIRNMIQQRIGNKPIELSIEVDKSIPNKLHGDEIRFRQILINLLNNAVKFTDKGKIAFKLRMRRDKDETIFLASVSDTGIGIKKDDLSQLFQSFQRVDMQKNRTLEGTGLGLSICKTLLELMNGRISVESEYGVGSTFYFELPQKIVDELPTYQEICEQKKKHRKKLYQKTGNISMPDAKVLVVDDNEMNLRVAQGLMQPYSMKIDLVKSGKECIKCINTKQYDLIMLDHMMPEMDGIETLDNLKKIEGFSVPVIALTANAISGVKDMYLEKGFDDYLSKPIDCVKLEEILVKYLEDKVIQIEKQEQEVETFEYDFENISSSLGMHYSGGNVTGYIEVLKVYLRTGNDIIGRLKESYDNNAWNTYKIDIHALKSSSMSIGAEELSDLCRRLEEAAKNSDITFIKQNHNAAMDVFYKVLLEIEEFVNLKNAESEANKQVITDKELISMLIEVNDNAQQFIMVKAEQIIEKILSFEYTKINIKPILDDIKESISIYDTDVAGEKIRKLIEDIKTNK